MNFIFDDQKIVHECEEIIKHEKRRKLRVLRGKFDNWNWFYHELCSSEIVVKHRKKDRLLLITTWFVFYFIIYRQIFDLNKQDRKIF